MNIKKTFSLFLSIMLLSSSNNLVHASNSESSYSFTNLLKPAALFCTSIAMVGYAYFKANQVQQQKIKEQVTQCQELAFDKERDAENCKDIIKKTFDSRQAPCFEKGIVLRANKQVLGFISYSLKDGVVDLVAVHPDYQRNGLGKRMLQAAYNDFKKHDVKSMSLTARPHLSEFYKKQGFNNVCGLGRYHMIKEIR